MIIARSPLRVSLGGGGTDLPSYYRKHGGLLLAGAINHFVYVTIHRSFNPNMHIRYSQIEQVERIDDIVHPIVREALRMLEVDEPRLEITSMADIPAGTGLGSSGSFTTALLKALLRFQRKTVTSSRLAELACRIELDILKEPIGKQDQYVAAHGGLNRYEFLPDDTVQVHPLRIPESALLELRNNLLMFSTGIRRSASHLLLDQDKKTKKDDSAMVENLHFIKDLGNRSCAALESGDLRKFGQLMHEHWLLKRKRSEGMSSPEIDRWYSAAMDGGAVGGKLIGAGGGGFLMFLTEDPQKLRQAMAKEGLPELDFDFTFEGTELVV